MAVDRSLPGLIALPFLAALLAAPMSGCGDPEVSLDTGFRVMGTLPENGEEDVVVSIQPELRLNSQASAGSCNANTLLLAAINGDGSIAFEPDYDVEIQDDSRKVVLIPEATLPRGWNYAMTLTTDGGQRCEDESGHELQPFGLEFYVP